MASETTETIPEWMADAARQARSARLDVLIAGMIRAGEDITDDELWRARQAQLDEMLDREAMPGQGEGAALRYDGTDPALPGGWVHEDGTPCPAYLAPANGTRWWCTEHQQYLKRPPAEAVARAVTPGQGGN